MVSYTKKDEYGKRRWCLSSTSTPSDLPTLHAYPDGQRRFLLLQPLPGSGGDLRVAEPNRMQPRARVDECLSAHVGDFCAVEPNFG